MSTIMPYKLRVEKLYLDNCGETILRRARLVMWFCAVLCITASAEATTYYVSTSGSDSNPGTIERPFGTVKKAVGVLRAGDTLYIRGGTYYDRIEGSSFTASGTSGNPIIISGYPGETVTYRTHAEPIKFYLSGRTYIEIQDLIVDGIDGNSLESNGAIINDNYITLRRVEIKNAWMNGIISDGIGNRYLGLLVHDNARVPPETYGPGGNGLYSADNSSIVQGGSYYNNGCYGIRFGSSAAAPVRSSGNTIDGVRAYDNGSGKGLGGTSRCGSGGGGVVIGDTDNVVRNSIVYNNHTGVEITGFGGKMAQGAKVYNNTIYGNKGYGVGHGLGAGASDTQIINNILYLNGSTIIAYTASNIVQSNNFTSDPQFTDPARGDFTLRSGSAAIDAGIVLTAVPEDFAGGARPAGPRYDLGAYETNATVAAAPPTGAAVKPTPPQNVRLKG